MSATWSYLLAGLLLAILGAIAYLGLMFRSKAQAVVNATLNAQLARDSDELDLDKRLGLKSYVEIESVYGDAVTVAYRQCGHGPDLLCLHGIGASMLIYRRLAPLLAGDYRITFVDFPGFGASAKPRKFSYTLDEQAAHLARIITTLRLKRPLAIASSMGGAIALKAATDGPDLFRGVVALAPAVDPRRVPTVLLPLAKHAHRFHRISSLTTTRAAVQAVIARRELITPALVALYQEPFRDQGDSSSAFMKAFALLADTRMPNLFRTMTTPLLIIRGLRDRLVKQAGCEDLRRAVKNAKLITHPSAGHHIMEDEPEFIANEIRKFDVSL
jgi:pimeloyl-ACP methyl ester carboxylesterase